MACAISRIDHVALTANDLAASVAFYCQALEGRVVHDFVVDGRVIAHQVRIGAALVNLHQAGHGHSLVARQPTPGSGDLCFGWSEPIATAVAHLRGHGIPIEEGPVARTGCEGLPGQSVYFRDPDGNLLEFLSTTPDAAAAGETQP